MARKKAKRRLRVGRLLRRLIQAAVICLALVMVPVMAFRFIPPPINIYQAQEWVRHDGLKRDWVALSSLPSHVPLSAAAAEDANFCVHIGVDFAALRAALADGAQRGGSTISQQTAKNVFLWQGRSWVRKGLEAGFTVLIEGLWPKWRIMEVYLNIAEFDTGVFGIEAAAQHYFGHGAAELSPTQAARLMAVLPNPKERSASNPSAALRSRAGLIAAGARTLAVDGRGACVRG